MRVFGESGDDYQVFPEPVVLDFPEKPEYFETEMKVPTAMTYSELKEYSQEVRNSGQVAPELDVELSKKISYPTVSLIMALVALPFSFRLGRRGALYGVGIVINLGVDPGEVVTGVAIAGVLLEGLAVPEGGRLPTAPVSIGFGLVEEGLGVAHPKRIHRLNTDGDHDCEGDRAEKQRIDSPTTAGPVFPHSPPPGHQSGGSENDHHGNDRKTESRRYEEHHDSG